MNDFKWIFCGPTSNVKLGRVGVLRSHRVLGHALVLPLVRLLTFLDLK